ncbi:2,3,4,5-tetrahydropyridine-2,6-dicarboxylate N-succinyltransferase [Acetobacteraceae bacterium]|nr:2,3,4,5-tetrahydropyridine-2,6-dicarboxylate N-succinyltransferase [Acetobacteraceae bacterium]
MLEQNFSKQIEEIWNRRDSLSALQNQEDFKLVNKVLCALDEGSVRIASLTPQGNWHVNEWLKKAILLYFRLSNNSVLQASCGGASGFDKVPLKCAGWTESDFQKAGFRAVPGAIIRYSAHIEKGVVVMPSFINVGARVGKGTMIDTWATVGSCAQIGKNCHISGGAGIGGVLEPLQASPVIIEDSCFIGARSEVAEGVIIRKGSVLSMGVFLSASTRIIDRNTGEEFRGEVPPYSVVVPGFREPSEKGKPGLSCAVIVKRVDAQTRSKTGINELLRD